MSWIRDRLSRRVVSPSSAATTQSRSVKVVLVSDMFQHHAAENLPRDVQGFVYGLMQSASLEFNDFPHEAVLSAAADFYLASVTNDGHNGFIGNLEAYPTTSEQVCEGLQLVELHDVAAVYADLLAYEASDPEHFGATDWQDPVLQSLDDRLRPLTQSAYDRHANWLAAQPFIRVVPASEYSWKLVMDIYRSGGLSAVN